MKYINNRKQYRRIVGRTKMTFNVMTVLNISENETTAVSKNNTTQKTYSL